ncbi:MAG: gamma-glutamyltransferase [Bacteroidetes bacterium]|jgi:gamma-glutamyltranspeptidase/glutathione hydrolase|nr:gamma-glutamyltransferase [Bacteroidota bacterium]
MRRAILASLALVAVTWGCAPPSVTVADQTSNGPSVAKHGMVVSAHVLASRVGMEVLKSGGNAVDAAVATGLALAVVHPAAGNIGGGGFMIVRWKDGTTTSFDFREKAPAGAHERMYLDANGRYVDDLNHEGYLSVGVPGTIAGFDLALRRFGTRAWSEVTEPAVRLAAEGFPLSWSMASDFKALTADWKRYPASAKVFLKPDGSNYQMGETWKQPDLAETLRRIMTDGRDGFYQGTTARLLAVDMRANGGLVSEADLNEYEAVERVPIRGTYRDHEIVSMPPPSSGGTALIEMLNILEGYDLQALGHNSAEYLHLVTESMRRAFADRAAHMGDPDANSQLPIARLTSKTYAEHVRAGIDRARAGDIPVSAVESASESDQTTHYSVVDAEGNAVVVTYTLEYGYGSRIVADGLGFLLNNEMGDFNPVPGRTDSLGFIGTKANRVAPGKRMLSSMTPTIIMKDGQPWALIGSPGGRTIINTVLQVTLNLVDHRMSLIDAVAAKRVHHQWQPNVLRIERFGVSRDTEELLRAKGHRVSFGGTQGRVHGILVDPATRLRWGVADPRDPDGGAVGY